MGQWKIICIGNHMDESFNLGKNCTATGKLLEAKQSAVVSAIFSQNCTLIHVITYESS